MSRPQGGETLEGALTERAILAKARARLGPRLTQRERGILARWMTRYSQDALPLGRLCAHLEDLLTRYPDPYLEERVRRLWVTMA